LAENFGPRFRLYRDAGRQQPPHGTPLHHTPASEQGVLRRTPSSLQCASELLHEIAPAAKSIGYLYARLSAVEEPIIKAVETAAGTLGLRLVTVKVATASELEGAFATLVGEGTSAVLIGSLPWTNQIIALAAHYALPAMYPFPGRAEAGGLISYGGRALDAGRLAGTYVARILKGEKPGDLPGQLPTKFETVVNLKTAKALSLTIPLSILARADEVIE
jgi:putative ABC transport system substrate-binding protein